MGPELAARLDRLDLLSRKLLSGKLPGERRSKRRGRSVEFDDFRDYIPGDDLRHIDWNVYARLDRLFVKLFREEEDLALNLVVDASPSMDAGEPSKALLAHRLAMALAYVGVANQNRVSVTVFGGAERPRQLAPLRGRASARRIAAFLLDSFEPSSHASPPDALNQALRLVARTRAGRGIVGVISDFLPADAPAQGEPDLAAWYRPGLNALTSAGAGGFDTYAIQVLSPGELDPAAEARAGLLGDLRLTDAESLRAREVTISSALIARYRKAIDAYTTRLHADCAARGVWHAVVRSDADPGAFILGALRRGGLVR